LIAGISGLRIRATLADHIRILAFAETVGLDPRFEGDRVAVLEVEETVRPWVFDFQVRAFAVEAGGHVGLLETWVVRATGTRLLEGDAACGGGTLRCVAIEAPHRHRLGGGEGREAEEKGDETEHL